MRAAPPSPLRPATAVRQLPKMGYTIQAGAFAHVENAANLTETLRKRNLAATYYVAEKGLYKVRFGDFPTREAARRKAEALLRGGVIEAYYIVSPAEYAVAKVPPGDESYVRTEIVKTAESFLGVPYLWGGNSAERGFDCSGLMVACYQLNGLNLPRTSREQFQVGEPVERGRLMRGDLVFFAPPGAEVNHVGIYVGDGAFIHAPGTGRKIRRESLASPYYEKRFAGGRSYL